MAIKIRTLSDRLLCATAHRQFRRTRGLQWHLESQWGWKKISPADKKPEAERGRVIFICYGIKKNSSVWVHFSSCLDTCDTRFKIWISGFEEGRWGGSVGKGASCWAWHPGFYPRDPQGGRREATPTFLQDVPSHTRCSVCICLWTSSSRLLWFHSAW